MLIVPEKELNKFPYEFYTQKRWENWLAQVKNSGFEIKESESEDQSGKESAIFVNMVDDVILACLKVIARFEKGILSDEGALEIIEQIREIVLSKVDPISDDIDLMIDSVQNSLIGTLAAFECYVLGDYEVGENLEDLIKAALEAEEDEELQIALEFTARCGASVIKGESLPDEIMAELPFGLVTEWLDGIDSIAAAMVGTDSYKQFDEEGEED